MLNFVGGHFSTAIWTPNGGAQAVLNIKDHTLDISVMLHDVTCAATAGVRARVVGPLDAAGTINADLDLDAEPWSPAVNLFAGLRGIVGFGYTEGATARIIQVPSSIEKLHHQGSMEKELTYSFDTKMNALAGLLVYPAL
jgi:hypothetical protein